MSSTQRVSLAAGTLVALLFLFVIVQSGTQVAKTQAQGGADDPTYNEGSRHEFASGEIIVTLEEQASQGDLRDLNGQTGADVEENLPDSDLNVVDLPQDLTVQEAVQRYEASPNVEYAEPNFKLYPSVIPNDPSFDRLWGLNNTGQSIGVQPGTVTTAVPLWPHRTSRV